MLRKEHEVGELTIELNENYANQNINYDLQQRLVSRATTILVTRAEKENEAAVHTNELSLRADNSQDQATNNIGDTATDDNNDAVISDVPYPSSSDDDMSSDGFTPRSPQHSPHQSPHRFSIDDFLSGSS